jgi:pyruvate formate lyase activating enzyme
VVSIGGLLPFTTVDYPGKLAAVVFLKGCPLRCAYCSNPHLLDEGLGPYDDEKVLGWLKERIGKLEAVVFSGGESLMQVAEAVEYMRRVKDMGFFIGLHTNGFYPEILESSLDIIDWTGLDFKATEGVYEKLTKSKTAYKKMIESLDLLLRSNKDFEVRITADPRFVSKSDIIDIAALCADKGVKSFAVQKYNPHFEGESNKTKESDRDQFFTDKAFSDKINGLFETVVWRQ